MIPLLDVKCLCLLPDQEQEQFTLNSLNSFINNDCHEGYPMIINYNNPIIVGYIPKSQLLNQLFYHYQIEKLIQIHQFHFKSTTVLIFPERVEQLLSQRKQPQVVLINVHPIQSTLIINENPILLIIEMFEKLHLNSLIIVSNQDETLMTDSSIDLY